MRGTIWNGDVILRGRRKARVPWPEPEAITEAHKNGERHLVWYSDSLGAEWTVARWDITNHSGWFVSLGADRGAVYLLADDKVTYCVAIPPDVVDNFG